MSKQKQSDLERYIYNEYIFNNESLQDYQNVTRNLDLLVSNKLAVCISGSADLLYDNRFTLYRYICKFMCDKNKSLKKYLSHETYADNSIFKNKAGVDQRIIEYMNYSFPHGLYYVELKSKNTDEFAVLSVHDSQSDSTYQSYDFYFVGKKCYKNLKHFYKEYAVARDQLQVDSEEKIIYSNGKAKNTVIFKSFDQMVFTDKQKYLSYIDNWVDSIPIYHKYGMIPKLSILLYGDPGTGKSTFCKALAKYLGIHTVKSISADYFHKREYELDKPKKYTGDTRAYLANEQIVYSIDDIDCIGSSRDTDTSHENGKVISELLEFLDNPPTFYFKAKDGKFYQVAIVCATTNYYDRLDPAVKRFGRFDLTIQMNRFNKKEAEEMCRVYDLKLKDVYKDTITDDTTFSPAHIQALCLENIDKNLKKKGTVSYENEED